MSAGTTSPRARSPGQPGEPTPRIEYTDAEHEVWRIVSRELAPKHVKYACRDFQEAAAALALPTDHIPQLDEVTAGLRPLTGWSYHAAAGLVPLREFLGSLGDQVFHSTQYIRHGAMPLYTPEPDLIHEVIGHGNLLASPRFAAIKREAGLAAQRVETEEALQFLADVFWFTIEFGVLREDGEVRAYGAGILSSYGEIEEFRGADLRPLDLLEMGTWSTTSRTTSRSCSAPTAWASSRTWSAASSRPSTTTRPRACGACRPPARRPGSVRVGTPRPMDYQIDHDPIERGHLVVASGELDIAATPRLSTVLAMAAARPGGRMVLDLSDVTFIDSTALGTILKAAAQLDDGGTLLAVVVPDGPVRRLLEMTNLTQRFRLFGTRAAALAADGAPA